MFEGKLRHLFIQNKSFEASVAALNFAFVEMQCIFVTDYSRDNYWQLGWANKVVVKIS